MAAIHLRPAAAAFSFGDSVNVRGPIVRKQIPLGA